MAERICDCGHNALAHSMEAEGGCSYHACPCARWMPKAAVAAIPGWIMQAARRIVQEMPKMAAEAQEATGMLHMGLEATEEAYLSHLVGSVAHVLWTSREKQP